MANLPIIYNRKDGLIMTIKVRVFLGNEQIESSELHRLTINNKSVDRYINEIADRKETNGFEVADVKIAS